MLKLKEKLSRKLSGANNNAIILIVVAVVIVILAIVLALVMSTPKGVTGDAGKLASFYPDKTLFYANLDITPDKLQRIQGLSGNTFSLENLIKAMNQASKNPEESMKAVQIVKEFNKTIEPKFSVGIWKNNETVSEPDQLLFSTIVKEKANVDNLLKNLTDNQVNFKAENIEGVEAKTGTENKGGAYAVMDDVLLIANNTETLKEAIKTHKGNNNILSRPEANDVLANLPESRMLTVLFNTSDISNEANNPNNPADSNPLGDKMGQIKKISSSMSFTGIGVDVQKDVLVAKSYTPFKLESLQDPAIKDSLKNLLASTDKLEAPSILPGNTSVFLSIAGLSQIFNMNLQMMNDNEKEAFKQQSNMISMITGGLDIEKDIVPIFSEEFTIAGRLNEKKLEPIVLLSKKSDTMTVLNKLLGTIPKTDKAAKLEEKDVSGAKLQLISSKAFPFPVAYGEIGKNVVIGRSETVELMASESTDKAKTLADTPLYKSLISQMTPNPNFVLYVNTDELIKVLKETEKNPEKLKQLEEMNKKIAGIIVSFNSEKEKALVGNLLMTFKK